MKPWPAILLLTACTVGTDDDPQRFVLDGTIGLRVDGGAILENPFTGDNLRYDAHLVDKEWPF